MAQKKNIIDYPEDILEEGKILKDAAEDSGSEMNSMSAQAVIELGEAAASPLTVITKESDKEVPVRESRVKKTLLNAKVNLLYYFLNLLLSFFTRKVFLDCLGEEFLGLGGTLGNILGLINLAELGIGSAIGYLLYKPLFEKDEEKINEIISVMGYLYHIIGYVILVTSIVVSFFLPAMFPNTGLPMFLIFFTYYAFLGSGLLGYFINYRTYILGADQRQYVVTAYFQTANILKTLLQLILAYYTKNYYLWVGVEFSFGIINCVVINRKVNKTYPWLSVSARKGRQLFKKYPEVMKKSGQLFVQKIAVLLTTQSSSILIYKFVSLPMVAVYGSYTIIIDKINMLVLNSLSGVSASVGNLIAEGNLNKTKEIYKELLTFHVYAAGLMFFGLFFFADPFIQVWLGEKYVIGKMILVPIFLFFSLELITAPNNSFLYGFGLFKDIWAPLTEAAIFLVVAIVLGAHHGLWGILMGRLISLLVIRYIWKPYYLCNKGLKCSVGIFWWVVLPLAVLQTVVAGILYLLMHNWINSITTWKLLISAGGIYMISLSLLSMGLFALVNRSYRRILKRACEQIIFRKKYL